MTATLLDGKRAREAIVAELATRLRTPPPGLRVLLIGENPASVRYVRNKERTARELGIDAATLRYPTSITQAELLAQIAHCNADPAVHGILVQMPLPPHIDTTAVILAIDPAKDVDGLHPMNQGLLLLGQPGLHPCTPKGVLRLLQFYGIEVAGLEATVIGRSILVGRPLAALLLLANATVTVSHSQTPDLARTTAQADLVIAAVGKPGIITADMIKPGAIVVDVGINTVAGKLVGDVAFAEVAAKAAYLTPVPGGIGPMTIAMLMENTFLAYELRHGVPEGFESLTNSRRWFGALGADLPQEPLFPTD